MKKILILITLLTSFTINAETLEAFSLPVYGKDKTFNIKNESKKYKKVVINFWASWCTACIQEMDELEALKKKYEQKGVLFIAVNAGESKKKIRKFLKRKKFSYLILEDGDRKVSKSLNVTELPRTIIVDKKLKIIYNSDKPPKSISL